MKETLEIINQMQRDGIVGAYAIGGAVGATFHLEPVATLDIDVFVSFTSTQNGALISLSPLYDYLGKLGCEARGEYVVIAGWPVQFLPPSDALAEEALAAAISTDVDGVPTRVMSAEHLVALALQLGRAKDHARIVQFCETDVLRYEILEDILRRHKLDDKWDRFKKRFMMENDV